MTTVPQDLDERFRLAASAAGLIDAAYDLADSPVGTLLLAATDRGLARIAYDVEAALEELGRTFGLRLLRVPRRLDAVRREVDEYFGGERSAFDFPTDVSPLPSFQRLVLGELARAPSREAAAYGTPAVRIAGP